VEWTESTLNQLSSEELQLVLWVAAAVGIFYCFLGYRLFRLVLGVTGFLLAGASAAVIAGWLSQGQIWAMGAAALAGGICGAMALFFLYRAGVFLLGALGGALIGYTVFSGVEEAWAPWAIIGCAAGVGLVALVIEKPVMTLATAALGAALIVYSGALLLPSPAVQEALQAPVGESALGWALIGAWVACTAVGMSVQFTLGRPRPAE
jgi:hypothetical protein